MPGSFKKIGLVGRRQQDGLDVVLQELLELLGRRGHEVFLEDRLGELIPDTGLRLASRDEIGEASDLVIVAGGDGSMLSAARTMAKYETPVLGVNRGRLGFLPDITPDQIAEQVPRVLDGDYDTENRFLLDASVERNGEPMARADALNDVVVNSGTSAQMREIELSIDGKFIYRQRADGLSVSTPTGSTA